MQKHNKPFVLLLEIECISPGENVNLFFLVKISSLPAEIEAVMTIVSAGNHFQCAGLRILPGGDRQK